MTPTEYLAALARLGLSPASQATARALGVTVRQAQRYASGVTPVPKMVEIVLGHMLRAASVNS